MKWVTRKRVHVNRAATAWLICRFVDQRLGEDTALKRLARIVHGADFPHDAEQEPE